MQQQMKQHNFYMIDKYIHNLQIQLKQEIYILSVETVLNFQKCMFAIRKCSDLPKNVGFSEVKILKEILTTCHVFCVQNI